MRSVGFARDTILSEASLEDDDVTDVIEITL